MIGGLVRRLLCRVGRHHVVRCAGAVDHVWSWDGDGWTAALVAPVRPVTPVAADQHVYADPSPAGKNDHGPVGGRGAHRAVARG